MTRISAGCYQEVIDGYVIRVVKREDNLWYWTVDKEEASDLYYSKKDAYKAAKAFVTEEKLFWDLANYE